MPNHKVIKKAIPIYFGWLLIVFSNDFKHSIKKLKLNTQGRDDLHEFAAVTFNERDKQGVTQYIMLFPKKPDHCIIAHEIVHTVNAIMFDRRIELDPINDEAQAYLTGWVTQQVYKIMKKAQ